MTKPQDEFDAALLANVQPADWQNPRPAARYDLVVLGAGTAGLVSAAGAAGVGAKVALIEGEKLGGDCLNVGCVPSKALLRSAHVAAEVRDAGRFGIRVAERATVDFPEVMRRMRAVRAGISSADSVSRFSGELGVDVFLGHARFSGPAQIEVGDASLNFKRAVIATGARPVAPSIPGLDETGYLTGPESNPKWHPLVNNGKGKLPGMRWNRRGHTNSLIPFFAKGAGAKRYLELADETDPKRGAVIDNTELAKPVFEMMR